MFDVNRRMTSPVFVGREAELEALDGALARAAGGEPAFAFIGGESGVGKTRLMAELQARARARGMRTSAASASSWAARRSPTRR